MCFFFLFFLPQEPPKNVSERCKGNKTGEMFFYPFMCRIAEVANIPANCEFHANTTDSFVHLPEKQVLSVIVVVKSS